MVMTLVLVWWNARDISSKETVFKEFLADEGAVYAGISEPMTYRQEQELSDRWAAGHEHGPTEARARPHGGVGAFIDKTKLKASIIRSGRYTLWHRVELRGSGGHMVVGSGYFPHSQDIKGHKEANKELLGALQHFVGGGAHVAFGGDLNAHIGPNGNSEETDAAGQMLMDTADKAGMIIVNNERRLCNGGPTRVQVRVDGIQQSTIDYVMCSRSLSPHISSLRIDTRQMEPDHRPLILSLTGLPPDQPKKDMAREVWKVSNIPLPTIGVHKGGDWSWINACQARFEEWIRETGDLLQAVRAVGADSARVGDILDCSFQRALDHLAAEQIGSKVIKPRVTPSVDAATRLAIEQREVCEAVMKHVMQDTASSELAKVEARRNFLHASRQARQTAAKRKQIERLRVFRDVEEHQADSRAFWGKFKQVRGSITVDKSPPPVAYDTDGGMVTDPVEVLRAWRNFSACIASTDLTGTTEEGIYDEDYKKGVEQRLEWLRNVKIHQPDLDHPITAGEVFRALRKLRTGKAPGEDGILTDILKSATNAVNNNKLRGNNTVVDAIVLLFNYVFDNEIWPTRWGAGIIFPLHKHDSRLDPANYRPITLLSVVGKLFGAVINGRLCKFAEETDSICDEQGGFRPNRGTPDQIFIFREILASRRERREPTYACFVDVKKAYDTVWREQAYTRIYDSGVRGKLWRQLQAMHSVIERKVKHPLGMTDTFKVGRGVAQGAVESPLVYSSFINGLTMELKAAGHGIMIAGVRVPCLMYADDVVMLAGSQTELAQMLAIASAFARKNRFQYNGTKSGIMIFGASKAARVRAEVTKWSLFGSDVKIVDKYVYLGTVTQAGGLAWDDHLRTSINKARRRSADLLWVCRSDRGMRSRTAVTLWQAMVRPLLEYASELWYGQVPEHLAKKAESVQMTFLRGTLGLHGNGAGIADEVVRAETGCERMQDRWLKLKLGFWRRLYAAKPTRLLRKVAEARHTECVSSGGIGRGGQGWMTTARDSLQKCGLEQYWDDPSLTTQEEAEKWQSMVYEAADSWSDNDRRDRMATLSSTTDYVLLKEWGNPRKYSFSSGETDRLGQHVPERYLDDRDRLKGTRLKMLCRTGALPVMRRIGRELSPPWPPER